MFRLELTQSVVYKNKIVFGCIVLLFLASLVLLIFSQDKRSYEKTQQQIGLLASAVRSHYAWQPHYWGLSNEQALQKKIVPQTLLNNNKIMSALGRPLLIGADLSGTPVPSGDREFMISVPNLSKKSCEKLILLPLSDNIGLGLLKIVVENNHQLHTFEWGGENPLPIQAQAAQNICAQQNNIGFVFN